MTNDTSATLDSASMAKLAVSWIGALIGTVTLQQWVLVATGIFTVLQIYVLVRDKIIRDKKDKL